MNTETKTVAICLNHKWVDGMMERILKEFPNSTHINIDGPNCAACNGKI